MTQSNNIIPFLFINRIVIISAQGVIAYDQLFHQGVNIIRGDNSSGKSTVSNLIFYGLGGDYSNWTDAALDCREIYLELNINNQIITVSRSIVVEKRQPMSIFFGTYNEASQTNKGWTQFSYSISKNKMSFSNRLFQMLDFPELKGDFDSNITMHQILRLLFIDQQSLTESFLRTENYDSPITRRTIYDLLLGVYDDGLYAARLEELNLTQKLDIVKKQISGLKKVFSKNIEISISKDELIEAIKYFEHRLIEVNELLISNSKEDKSKEEKLSKQFSEIIKPIQEKILKTRHKLLEKQKELNEIIFEIKDSELFIEAIDKKIEALNNSMLTEKELGELYFTHCPICLLELQTSHNNNSCSLCKQPLQEDANKLSPKGRMLQELHFQLKESKKIQRSRNEEVKNIQINIPTLNKELKLEQSKLDYEYKIIQSTRNKGKRIKIFCN
jgi:hypothetical protein